MKKLPSRSDAKILRTLAESDSRDIVERLLNGSASQKQLRDELDIPSGTVSKRMAELEALGLVERRSSHAPYVLRFHESTQRVLQALANLGVEISAEQARIDREAARGVTRAGMTRDTREASDDGRAG